MVLVREDAQSTIPYGVSAPVMQVQPPAEIAVFPAGPDMPATEFVSWAQGRPQPSVQWEMSLNDGVDWAPISDANEPTYVIPEITDEVGNQYRAVFANKAGTVTSVHCTLVLADVPA